MIIFQLSLSVDQKDQKDKKTQIKKEIINNLLDSNDSDEELVSAPVSVDIKENYVQDEKNITSSNSINSKACNIC